MEWTNRSLYQTMTSMLRRVEIMPTLDEYLRSLWGVVWEDVAVEPTLEPSAERLLAWCEAALTATPPTFDLEWLYLTHLEWPADVGFAEWERLIQWQIADLWRMDSAGTLDQPGIYLGVNSPSRARWYNFDSYNYLECGIRGTFGGYKGDKIKPLSPLSWADLCGVLECGRVYE